MVIVLAILLVGASMLLIYPFVRTEERHLEHRGNGAPGWAQRSKNNNRVSEYWSGLNSSGVKSTVCAGTFKQVLGREKPSPEAPPTLTAADPELGRAHLQGRSVPTHQPNI